MKPQLYNYSDPVEFLNALLKSKQTANPQYSLRSWVKQLGLNNVAMLSMVLNKKRRLLPRLSTRISQHLLQSEQFNEEEARYFDTLVHYHNSNVSSEKIFYEKLLSSLRPDKHFSTIELDTFRVLTEWYHIIILEMTFLKDFVPDAKWIVKKMHQEITLTQAQEALDRLLRLELLKKDKNGKLSRTTKNLKTPDDIPNEHLRKLHAQMIQRSIKALEGQTVKERDITTQILSIQKERIPGAKEIIKEFRVKLSKYLESHPGDSVYQINIQFFNTLGGEDGN